MSSLDPRPLILPFAAVAVVAVVLAVQLASGGASYGSTASAPASSPCVERALPAASTDLEPVIEDAVLGGLERAACSLGVTREALLLALPSSRDRLALARAHGSTEAGLEAALKTGMLTEVRRLDRAGLLPPASALVDTYADQLGLSGLAATAIKQVPSSVVDGLLPTGEVLERAIGGLDVGRLLTQFDQPGGIEPALRTAIQDAAVAEAKSRLLDQVPDSLRGLLGG
ncbi:MAG: hypothetical protein AAGC46_04270 [Solirubrobacteraceae bacterium]|nr:hypothetical protein [Patulibacter sp.]